MTQHIRTARFDKDWRTLTSEQRKNFVAAFLNFDADLTMGQFREGLGVKEIQGTPGAMEMSWTPEGRATFELRTAPGGGRAVVWRRVGAGVDLPPRGEGG